MCSFNLAMAFYMCLESPVIWFSFLWVVDTCPSARVVRLVSEVGRLASLASLGSVGARVGCGVRDCANVRIRFRTQGFDSLMRFIDAIPRGASLASLCSARSASVSSDHFP